MFHGRSSPAPEAEHEALTFVLYRAFLFIRLFSESSEVSAKEKGALLSDLADALHNVPIVLERYERGHDADYLVTLFFRAFDTKWKHIAGAPRLEAIYSSSIEEIRERGRQNA